MLGIPELPGARSVRYLPHKRCLRLGGRTSPVFVRLYDKVEHDLQLTRLEVVLRKPRLQALRIRDIDDIFRLSPHVLVKYVLHSRVQHAQLEGSPSPADGLGSAPPVRRSPDS